MCKLTQTTLRRKSRILPKCTQWILFFPHFLFGLLSFLVKPKTSGSYCHNHFQRAKIFQRTRWHFTIAHSKFTQPRLMEPAHRQWTLELFWKLGPGESDSHTFKPAATWIVRLVTAGIKRPFTDTCITEFHTPAGKLPDSNYQRFTNQYTVVALGWARAKLLAKVSTSNALLVFIFSQRASWSAMKTNLVKTLLG